MSAEKIIHKNKQASKADFRLNLYISITISHFSATAGLFVLIILSKFIAQFTFINRFQSRTSLAISRLSFEWVKTWLPSTL